MTGMNEIDVASLVHGEERVCVEDGGPGNQGNNDTQRHTRAKEAEEPESKETVRKESVSSAEEDGSRRSVRFEAADIVEFEPTVYTATVSSEGVPVGMSSQVRRRTRRRLDSFEVERKSFRITKDEYMDQGYLEPEDRLDLLENAGIQLVTMFAVERDVIRINRERWESNECDSMHQRCLGEIPMLEGDENEDVWQYSSVTAQDSEDEVMDDLESEADTDRYFNVRSYLTDADVRSAMEMDCYGNHQYHELGLDDNDFTYDDNDELYSKLSVQSPYCQQDYDLSDLGSSPSDVSQSSSCLIRSCSTVSQDRPSHCPPASPSEKTYVSV